MVLLQYNALLHGHTFTSPFGAHSGLSLIIGLEAEGCGGGGS